MQSQSLLASVIAAISAAALALRGALAQSASATATGYTGCYADSASRVLGYGAYSASDNTPGMCQAVCNNAGYIYSGTEYGNECFCGNTLSNPADSSACDSPCTGDASQTCGGDWHLSVYEGSGVPSASPTPSAVAAPAVTSAAAFISGGAYLGCYVDAGSTGTRTLNYGAYTSHNNTNELCQSTCAGLGYAYSGTEYGVQCFCDNTLHSGVTTDSDCNVACPGSSNEMCGGSWRLTVYSTGAGSSVGSGASGSALGDLPASSVATVSTPPPTFMSLSVVSPTTAPPTTISVATTSIVATTIVAFSSSSATSNTILSQSSKATPSSTAVASPIPPTATTSAGSSFATPSSFASQTTVSVKPSAVISSTSSAASTTAKTTTATSTSTSSSAAPTSTGTGYVGCYFNLTPLISLAYTSSVNTNALCRATCYGKGYAYAGTTGGLQCSCAHSLGFAFQAPALTCNLPCSGDWSQACGGPGSVSVYKT